MGIDHPDDADVPPDEPADHPADRARAETRYRQEYDADLRATSARQERTEPAGHSEPGARAKTGEQAEPTARSEPGEQAEPAARPEPAERTGNARQARPGSTWEETAELSRWMSTEYKRRWPPKERPAVDRSKSPPGSWHGEGGRVLKPADNQQVEAACDRIADREEKTISPAMRAIESQDPDRYLVGFKHCRKGRDRIKEEVNDNMKALPISPDEALSRVPDAIRYTFQYEEHHYTGSVRADITRLRDQGFKHPQAALGCSSR